MNDTYLLHNCVIISPDLFIPCGEVLVEKGVISGVGNCGELMPDLSEKDSADIMKYDLGGRFLLPGLTNPHAHLYSSLAAGLSPLGPNDSFTGVLENFWWPLDAALDEESTYYSALSGIIDAVKHGVTCIVDHHASMNFVRGSLEQIERAFKLAGIKGILCFETSNRKSAAPAGTHIEENLDFISSHITDGNIRGMLGLHANFTLDKKTMEKVSDAAADSGLNPPIHIHCGEGKYDFDYCVNDGFAGPVDRLVNFNLLTEDSILAHCIYLSKKDIELIEDFKPFIISNPESNANNRVGRPDRSLFENYLIGTDGMSFDMVASLRSQYLLGEGLSEDFSRLYDSFIIQPSILLKRFFRNTGRIEEGFDADIAVLDYVPETPVSSDNIIGHLLFGAKGGKSFMTVSNGNILYHDGKLTFTFESSIKNQIRTAADKLHRRYYGKS